MNNSSLIQQLAQIEVGVRTAANYTADCYKKVTGKRLNPRQLKKFTNDFRIAFALWGEQKEKDGTPLEEGAFTVSIKGVTFRVEGCWVPVANMAPHPWGIFVTEVKSKAIA